MSLNLVKYAGDFWVTLADYTQTRDTKGYSDHASVKSAIRTFVVKQSPEKYIAFRGEVQLKNIIQENKHNPLFNPDDFQGTRTALIHWSMLEKLNERFNIDKKQDKTFKQFMEEAEEMINREMVAASKSDTETPDFSLEGRSAILRQLRNDLSKIDREMEIKSRNREKLLQAINSIESLELEDLY